MFFLKKMGNKPIIDLFTISYGEFSLEGKINFLKNIQKICDEVASREGKSQKKIKVMQNVYNSVQFNAKRCDIM